ncbi:MAG: 16S rRNA (guanine(966)-N(2))-methyltransferase RsmD, partial [Thermoleophilaceae bacterium]
MRVVAGTHRGRRLHRPPGLGTRPTSDRVREALFSMLADNVTGARVLDLFAGSGALGIEALSRGAARAVFVESSRSTVETVQRNLSELGLDARVHRRDALSYLRGAGGSSHYDLVFLDPPYDCAPRVAAPVAGLLPAVLTENALIVT